MNTNKKVMFVWVLIAILGLIFYIVPILFRSKKEGFTDADLQKILEVSTAMKTKSAEPEKPNAKTTTSKAVVPVPAVQTVTTDVPKVIIVHETSSQPDLPKIQESPVIDMNEYIKKQAKLMGRQVPEELYGKIRSEPSCTITKEVLISPSESQGQLCKTSCTPPVPSCPKKPRDDCINMKDYISKRDLKNYIPKNELKDYIRKDSIPCWACKL